MTLLAKLQTQTKPCSMQWPDLRREAIAAVDTICTIELESRYIQAWLTGNCPNNHQNDSHGP